MRIAEPPECALTTRVVCALRIWPRVQVPSIIECATERRAVIPGAVAMYGPQPVVQRTRFEGDAVIRDWLATAITPKPQGPFSQSAGRTVRPYVLRSGQVSSGREQGGGMGDPGPVPSGRPDSPGPPVGRACVYQSMITSSDDETVPGSRAGHAARPARREAVRGRRGHRVKFVVVPTEPTS